LSFVPFYLLLALFLLMNNKTQMFALNILHARSVLHTILVVGVLFLLFMMTAPLDQDVPESPKTPKIPHLDTSLGLALLTSRTTSVTVMFAVTRSNVFHLVLLAEVFLLLIVWPSVSLQPTSVTQPPNSATKLILVTELT
jgi:hypothetical protein